MRRREFIGALGGAAAWPLAARAQPPERMRRIGVLMPLAADDPEAQARLAAFRRGFKNWAGPKAATCGSIFAWPGATWTAFAICGGIGRPRAGCHPGLWQPVMAPLQQATRTVPIVFVQTPDPVGSGFVESLARPGGNATGFTQFEYGISGKWLELRKEIAPRLTRAAALRTPPFPPGRPVGAVQAVAPSFGVELSPVDARERGRSSAPSPHSHARRIAA